MTLNKTYYPLAGFYQITDATLAYCKILMVARSGVVHSQTDVDQILNDGGPFYEYYASLGQIEFNPTNPFNQDESINVVYDPNI
jgi:hypothetical protein